MDQIKIGRFIAACRKDKGLTQRQLAEMLCVSDKAISKWETGKGLPEAQLMLPLCEALGISVNELLSGERLTEIEYQRKAEENMVNLAEKKVYRYGSGVKTGIGFGAALAMVLSYHTYTSVWLAMLHGVLGWIYVLYHIIKF